MRLIDYVTLLGLFSILIWPVAFILGPVVGVLVFLFRRKKLVGEMYPGKDALLEMAIQEQEPIEDDEYHADQVVEELPFCQLFTITPDMCLMIHHVEMCPDETAFIRVVDDEGYTPLYKRKVRRDKNGNRLIVFNGANHYLDDKKTQPIVVPK